MVPPRSVSSSRFSTSPAGGAPFGDQADHRMRRTACRSRCCWRLPGRRRCARNRPPPPACRSRCRNTARRARARIARSATLPSKPRSPKPPGTRMPSTSCQRRAAPSRSMLLGFQPLQVDARALARGRRACSASPTRLVGVLVVDVLADDRDGDLVDRMLAWHRPPLPIPTGRRSRACRPAAGCSTTISSRPCACSHSGIL